jgi:hypothetical protein
MAQVDSYRSADVLQCAIARHYEKPHGASVVSIGNAPKWDIRFVNGITMEVKLDAMAAKTLNAAIEFWDTRRDKPTGILETTASLWLHCVPEDGGLRCYEIQTKKLLKLCLEAGELKAGGDYGSSQIKIFPLQRIREVSNQDFWLEDSLWKQ